MTVDRPDIQSAIDALLDGHATDEQIAALETWIAESPDHADRFAHQTLISGRLHMLMNVEQAREGSGFRVQSSGQSLTPTLRTPTSVGGRSVWYALAAAVTLALTAWFAFLPEPHPGPIVGMITDMHHARWARGTDPPQTGQSLAARRLELESGRIQMMFQSGAVVDLIGPAVFEMVDSNQGRLERGQLLAWVPGRAVGFTVQTPGGRVVDLGTEFALRVDAVGACLLQVLSGRVQVDGLRREVLVAGQSVRYSAEGVDAITQGDSTLFNELLRPSMMFGYVHYDFDEPGGLQLLDTGNGLHTGPRHARIAWTSPGHEGPDRIVGRHSKALYFDGINDYVATDGFGPAGRDERTVALWARIPRDVESKHAYALFSYGRNLRGQAWQMSWNNEAAADQPLGVLRLGTSGQSLFGRTDLRDGQWHHLAATFDGTALRLYVDGVLEAERPAEADFNTAAGDGAQTVQLGRNLAGPTFFRGAIDDVFIFDGALSETELVRLMTTDPPHSQSAAQPIQTPPGE